MAVMSNEPVQPAFDSAALVAQIEEWARAAGFSQIGVAPIDLRDAEPGLLAWLDAGFHGAMDYMAQHGLKRARPAELVPGTLSVITARMDYLPRDTATGWQAIEWAGIGAPAQAQLSMYARGRDYHKVLRQRLQKLADRIGAAIGPYGYRCFTDSAPLLEVELASRSGLGWRGKHTLLLDRAAGSTFFLGEILVDLELPRSAPSTPHCGSCSACIEVCPTQAIVAPYRLDARRCIAYLTIEHDGPIPTELRAAIGNRIYGCDDCQLVCPWNKFATPSLLPDFDARPGLRGGRLLDLWTWDEARFLAATEGGPIRRIGWTRWRRNLAVGLGNALRQTGDSAIAEALVAALPQAEALVAEHIEWALAQAPGQGGAALA